MKLTGAGISLDLPPGWEGTISPPAVLADGAVRHSVTHLANFPLPAKRGDYGSGAVDVMGNGDLLVVLLEFGPESAGTPLFAARRPTSIRPADFDRDVLQQRIEGQSGVQRFFTEAGRAFCLYVVVGDHIDRADVTGHLDMVLAGLEIS